MLSEERESEEVVAGERNAEEAGEPSQPVAVHEVAQIYLSVFADLAFQRMGLHADRVAGVVVRDLAQAKLAVDIAAFIAEQLLPTLDEDARRELMNMISSLRLNYTRQMQQPAEPDQ